jgi:hypothetical protein
MSIRRSNRLLVRLEKAAANKEETPRAMAVVVAVLPFVGAVVHLPVVVDTRPYVEELWELEARVPEHRPRHPRAQKLKLRMEKPSKIRSKTSLSRTSLRRYHLT